EAHHPAALRPGVEDGHAVAQAGEMVGGREPRGAGADDEHPLAGRRGEAVDAPAAPDRLVAEKALDGVDPDGLVEPTAVARGLAGVVADPAHDRRKRVVFHDPPPGALVLLPACLRLVQPLLDVLAGRAGVVARRQPVDVDRPLRPPAAGLVGQAGADVEGDRERLLHHTAPSSPSRPKRSMLRSAAAWIHSITSVRGGSANRWAYRRCGRRYSSTGTRRRIFDTLTTSPCSASNTGNNPVSFASRASLTVSAEAAPQPSGHGTSTCR